MAVEIKAAALTSFPNITKRKREDTSLSILRLVRINAGQRNFIFYSNLQAPDQSSGSKINHIFCAAPHQIHYTYSPGSA